MITKTCGVDCGCISIEQCQIQTAKEPKVESSIIVVLQHLREKVNAGNNEAKRLASNGTYELAGFYSAQVKAFEYCINELEKISDIQSAVIN